MFRTCSKFDATWLQFFRKIWQKGYISGVPVGHISLQTVVYKLARQTISSMDTAVNKKKKLSRAVKNLKKR